MPEEEYQYSFEEQVQKAKEFAWLALAGWFGIVALRWVADLTDWTDSLFLVVPLVFASLTAFFCTPAFFWYFLPVSILTLPPRHQWAGHIVAAGLVALLPFLFMFDGSWAPKALLFFNEALQHPAPVFIVITIIVYLSRVITLGMRKFIPIIHFYLVACGISFMLAVGYGGDNRGGTYLFYLVLSYFGITLGWYEHHFGIAQRRAARVAERHWAKAAKQAKKDIERVVRNAERRPKDSSREGTNQNE